MQNTSIYGAFVSKYALITNRNLWPLDNILFKRVFLMYNNIVIILKKLFVNKHDPYST